MALEIWASNGSKIPLGSGVKRIELGIPKYVGGSFRTKNLVEILQIFQILTFDFCKSLEINERGERAEGIEPSCVAWKATVLPLNYARVFEPVMLSNRQNKCKSLLRRARHSGRILASFGGAAEGLGVAADLESIP
jgi:hypothetical protein